MATQRYPSTLTQRYLRPSLPQLPALSTPYWAESYRLDAPLPSGGEAEVYRAWDLALQRPVVVKIYHPPWQPKPAVLAKLRGVRHPHWVTLQATGHWQGRFYEVLDWCAGGTLAAHAPYTPDQLAGYLPAMAAALAACHQHGVIHRDVKPNNWLFLEESRQTLVLSDFGISSVLEAPSGLTRNAAALTLDYAAPELLERGEISPKTDYYALGITLIHLLQGHSPFVDKPQAQVMAAHLQNRIPLPPQLPPRWQVLLRGLTHGVASVRLGSAELSAWLAGADLTPTLPAATQAPPYPGFPSAYTPAVLAEHLTEFDALTQLRRGDIRRWVFDHFDPQQAETLAALEPLATAQPELALLKLRFALNPKADLELAGLRIHTPAQWLELLHDPTRRQALWPALHSGLLEDWLRQHQPIARSLELAQALGALRRRLRLAQNQERALVALRYLLEPQAPLELGPDCALQDLDGLEACLAQHPDALAAFVEQVRHGYLEEWLRGQPTPPDLLPWLVEQRQQHLDDPALVAYSLRWRLDPKTPFPFLGRTYITPAALAGAMDASPEATAEGGRLLESGWLPAWLTQTRRLQDPDALTQLLASPQPWPLKFETLLGWLNPRLPKPQLAVEPRQLRLGLLTEPQRCTWVVTNLRRGYLYGRVLAHSGDLQLTEAVFAGSGQERTEITVYIVPERAQHPGRQATRLTFSSNGGHVQVPIFYQTAPEPTLTAGDVLRAFWQELWQFWVWLRALRPRD